MSIHTLPIKLPIDILLTGHLWLTRVTRRDAVLWTRLPSACPRASASGRGRGWGCGAVYDLHSTLYSTMVHRSFNAIAHGRIRNNKQDPAWPLRTAAHRPPFLCYRIYYGALTMNADPCQRPALAQLLDAAIGCAPDLDHSDLLMRHGTRPCEHVAVKTAMEKKHVKQVRENAGVRRPIARAASGHWSSLDGPVAK